MKTINMQTVGIAQCDPCCDQCPEVRIGETEQLGKTVIITDDNTPDVLREVFLTPLQAAQLIGPLLEAIRLSGEEEAARLAVESLSQKIEGVAV